MIALQITVSGTQQIVNRLAGNAVTPRVQVGNDFTGSILPYINLAPMAGEAGGDQNLVSIGYYVRGQQAPAPAGTAITAPGDYEFVTGGLSLYFVTTLTSATASFTIFPDSASQARDPFDVNNLLRLDRGGVDANVSAVPANLVLAAPDVGSATTGGTISGGVTMRALTTADLPDLTALIEQTVFDILTNPMRQMALLPPNLPNQNLGVAPMAPYSSSDEYTGRVKLALFS